MCCVIRPLLLLILFEGEFSLTNFESLLHSTTSLHDTNKGTSSYENVEKLTPFQNGPDVLPRAAAQSDLITSGSGVLSGSGDLLVPESTPDYNTRTFISLTFTNLSSRQYHDHNLEERLCNLIVRLLKLDLVPLIIFESKHMSLSFVLVYFPSESTSMATLESYAKILGSSNDTEWTNLSSSYVSYYK